jgi:hypothetical protein
MRTLQFIWLNIGVNSGIPMAPDVRTLLKKDFGFRRVSGG